MFDLENLKKINEEIYTLEETIANSSFFLKLRYKGKLKSIYKRRYEIVKSEELTHLCNLEQVLGTKSLNELNHFINDNIEIYGKTFVNEWNNYDANAKQIVYFNMILKLNFLSEEEKKKINSLLDEEKSQNMEYVTLSTSSFGLKVLNKLYDAYSDVLLSRLKEINDLSKLDFE